MENKRAGISFKAVGVVGFILLAFLLLRVLRLPNGVLPSEIMPNFLMILLGVLVLASSFILLALGRMVELLENFKGSQALLSEIRDETERVRIESQYIYEVQKDTLVKLSDLGKSVSSQEQDIAFKQAQDKQVQDIGLEDLTQNESEALASKAAKNASSLENDAQINKLEFEEHSGVEQNSLIDQVKVVDQDVKANTDESTWSTLVSTDKADKIQKEDNAAELPLTDTDSDRAALDGSDDVVDAAPQPKTWKPVSNEELTSREKASLQEDKFQEDKFREAHVSEVKDYEISESLANSSDDVAKRESTASTKPKASNVETSLEHSELNSVDLNSKKPVFEDRLSQTEKIKDLSDNSVRFGSFPDEVKASESGSSFTLEDITDQDFSKNQENSTRQESLEEVFSNLKDSEKDSATQESSYEKESGFGSKAFASESFGSVDSNNSFESAEDSFDDIREVFDTKAKKLTAAVDSNRVKDRLKSVSDKIASNTSDIGKNLN